MANQEISLQFQNNTSGDIEISIMGNPSNLADNVNATREYQFNVTSLVFTTQNEVSILYKPNSASSYTQFVAPLLNQSINGVVQALNTLGIGSFFSFVSGGNTYISNYNDQYEFGVLDIYDNSVSTIDLYWQNTTTNSSSGSLQVDVNFINQVNSPNGLGQSGLLNVNNLDLIDVNVSASILEAFPQDFIIYRIPVGGGATENLYFNTVSAGGSDTYSFSIASNYVYYIYFGFSA